MLLPLRKLVAPADLVLVIFDLDGTLVDSVADLHRALCLMYNDLGKPEASIEQVRAWVGNGAAMLVARALVYAEAVAEPDHAEPEFAQAYARFMHHYAQVSGELAQCYEGVHALLASIREQGLHLALVTNKPIQFTHPLIARLGLAFDLVLGGDSLSQKKPSPLPLKHCLDHFSCRPEQAVMIGDSKSDVLAARAAQIKSIAVSYGYNHGEPISAQKPDLLVDSLTELS